MRPFFLLWEMLNWEVSAESTDEDIKFFQHAHCAAARFTRKRLILIHVYFFCFLAQLFTVYDKFDCFLFMICTQKVVMHLW